MGQDDGESRAFGRGQEHSVEAILDIVFGKVDWSEFGSELGLA